MIQVDTSALRRAVAFSPRLMGALLVATGVAVLGGWLAGVPWLIRLRADLPPMQPGIAVALAMAGAALLALEAGRPRAAAWLGAGVAIAGPYALLAYVLLEREPDAAGPMAPNAGLMLFAAGVALLLGARRRLREMALLASVVLAAGGAALAGHSFGVPEAYAWGHAPPIALHAAAAIVVLGVGLVAWPLLRDPHFRVSWLWPLLAALVVTLGGSLFWQGLRAQESEYIREIDRAVAAGLRGQISRGIHSGIDALERLAEHGVRRGWDSSADWRQDALLSGAGLPGLETIEWIQASGGEPRVVAQMNRAAPRPVESRTADRLRDRALAAAQRTQGPVVVGPFPLPDGRNSFRTIVPLPGRRPHTFLSGVFSADEALGDVAEALAPDHEITIRNEDREVFRLGAPSEEETYELPLALPGALPWTIEVTTVPALIAARRTAFPDIALVAAAMVAVLLATVLRLGQQATGRARDLEQAVRERTRDLRQTLRALRRENLERRRTETRLRRTQTVSRTVSAELALEKIVQTVTDAARVLTPATRAAFVPNPKFEAEDPLRLFATSGVERRAFREAGHPGDSPLLAPTFQGRQVIRADDLLDAPPLGLREAVGVIRGDHPFRARSYLAVPVVSRRGDVWGGLFLAHEQAARFRDSDQEAAVALAAQAAIALDNARLYQSERRAKDEARSASQAKDVFLTTLGHELRNPLGAIQSALEVLQTSPERPGTPSRMGRILRRQLSHLERLTDDLLDASRIAGGHVSLQRHPLDLAELVRDVVEGVRDRVEALGIRLDSSALPDEPVWVVADPTRLNQVMVNLVTNATRFTPAGGRITVSVRSDPETKRVSVSLRDTGCGLEATELERIFEPFFQGEQQPESGRQGLGLGLAIVRGFVEAHGGRVAARSEGPGRGSEFFFELPLGRAPESRTRAALGPLVPTPRRVAVIDDHRDGATALAELLSLDGHEVRAAHDGVSGLELARDWLPDVVICDLGLPGLSGHQVAKELRDDPRTRSLKLVALTGYGEGTSVEAARAAGFEHLLVKPAPLGELRAILRDVAPG